MAFMTNLLIAVSLISVARACTKRQAGYAASYAGSGSSGIGSSAGSYQGNGFNPFAFVGLSHFPGFGTFNFPPIHMLTPKEIADAKPADGQSYSGISVVSNNHVTRDKDGNLVKTGGSTVLTNDDGVVNKYSVGDSPPNIDEYESSIHDFEMPEMPNFFKPMFPKFKPFKPFKHHPFKHHVFEPITFKPIVFEPIVFEPIVFEPINPEDIRNHNPGENEHFIGTHVSSFVHSSNINGVKTSSGGSDLIVNNDGVVDEKNIRVGEHGESEAEQEREEHGGEKEEEREHQHEEHIRYED